MVKLRGRTTPPDRRPTISPGTRGAKQTTPHGPLPRLLGGTRCTFLSQRFQEVGRGTIVPLLKPRVWLRSKYRCLIRIDVQLSAPSPERCDQVHAAVVVHGNALEAVCSSKRSDTKNCLVLK